VEMEAFIRWLALDREQVRNYRRDPVGFLTGGRVSEPVRAALTKAGVEAVLARVRDMAEALHGPPDSWAPSSFNRDPSATGYGRRPAGGAQGDQC
jgi:hypothetical protein